MVTSSKTPSPRATAEKWIATGLQILEAEGHTALTVDLLCDRVGRTKGSFYHHFSSRDGFVVALLEVWEARATERIVAVEGGVGDPTDRLRELNRAASDLGVAGLERAMRSWAHHEGTVSASQERVDRIRLATVERLLKGTGMSRKEARSLARIFNLVFVGAQHIDPPLQGSELYATFRTLDPLLKRAAHA